MAREALRAGCAALTSGARHAGDAGLKVTAAAVMPGHSGSLGIYRNIAQDKFGSLLARLCFPGSQRVRESP